MIVSDYLCMRKMQTLNILDVTYNYYNYDFKKWLKLFPLWYGKN